MTSSESNFAKEKIALPLSRYELHYYKEDDCIEYFIVDKATNRQISRAVILSLDRTSKRINVGKFYPELYKQTECRYLSAACFYLLIHHFANIYHIPEGYRICLETRPDTYREFFSRLKDFHLLVERLKLCKTAEVCGNYPCLDIDISMIKEKSIEEEWVPFIV